VKDKQTGQINLVMRQCTTDDFEGFYTSNSAQESQIKAHKDAN